MYTQCPECLSVFSLASASLAQARGRVVCGHCHASFDALARLSDQPPGAAGGPLPLRRLSNELPIIDTPATADAAHSDSARAEPRGAPAPAAVATAPTIDGPAPATPAMPAPAEAEPHTARLRPALARVSPPLPAEVQPSRFPTLPKPVPLSMRWSELESLDHKTAAAAVPSSETVAPAMALAPPSESPTTAPEAAAEMLAEADAWDDFDAAPPPPVSTPVTTPVTTPSFAQPVRRRWRRGLWLTICVILLLLLLGQLAWVERDKLIANRSIGGWLRGACATLGCRLPLVQDLRQLRLLARDVQSHPSVAKALLISATVRNDAAFDQPYPVLTVTLSDADGKPLAMRRLAPGDYLDDAVALHRGIPAGGKVALMLEVDDPDSRAVGFELGFR